MPPAKKGKRSKRPVNLSLSEQTVTLIASLTEELNADNTSEVVRRSVTVCDALLRYRDDRGGITILSPEGERVHIVL